MRLRLVVCEEEGGGMVVGGGTLTDVTRDLAVVKFIERRAVVVG